MKWLARSLAAGLWFAALGARAVPPAAECVCPSANAAPAPIDLNTADERALLALPGVGPSRARAIITYREAHGGFRSLSQLLHIKGIGRALLRELRPLVQLSATAPP